MKAKGNICIIILSLFTVFPLTKYYVTKIKLWFWICENKINIILAKLIYFKIKI